MQQYYLPLFTTLLLAICGQAYGQACDQSIAGSVLDEHDGISLEVATIYLMVQQQGTYTDADGAFYIQDLCPGLDTLRITHLGCDTRYLPVTVGSAFAKTLRIELEHHTEFLEGVEVHAHRNQTSASDIGGTLSGEQLDRSAGADLATVVEALPGVRTVATGANVGRPIIDGLGGARLQIVQGGMALASQDWGDEHAPEIDPFATANVQLARSGGTVSYGRATTGATLVLDDASIPAEKELTGQALALAATNNGQGAAGLNIAQRISPNLGYRTQAFGSLAGDSRAPNYVLSNTGARRASGQAKLYYTDTTLSADFGYRGYIQESGILRAAHVGNLTDLRRALASGEPLVIRDYTYNIDAPRQVSAHHWFMANAHYTLKGQQKVGLSFSSQINDRQEYDIRRGGRSAIPSLDLSLTTTEIRVDYVHEPWWGFNGKLGLTAKDAENRNRAQGGPRPFVPFYDEQGLGLFIEEHSVKENLTIEVAGRIDYTNLVTARRATDETGFSRVIEWDTVNVTGALAVGLTRYLNPESNFRFRASYASRIPNPAERFADGVHHALAVIERGDTSLAVEHGFKAVLGYSYEHNEAFSLHFSGFAHGFRNFIYQERLAEPELTVRGAFPVVEYSQDDAILLGADVDVHFPLGPLQVDAQTGYLFGELASGEPLPDVSPWRNDLSLSYRRSLKGRLKDYRLNVRAVHTARQNREPDVLPAPAPDGYVLCHLEIAGHIALAQHLLGVHLSANNIFNTEYRDYLDRLRYYSARPGRDIRLRLLYDF